MSWSEAWAFTVMVAALFFWPQRKKTDTAPAPLKSLQHMFESERYVEARRRALAKRALAEQGKR